MKKIFSYFLAGAALFSLIPIIAADGDEPAIQKGPDYYLNNDDPEKASVGYMKSISEPNTDGVYTITLESFATGKSVKIHKSIPADIVLVLDVSGSMAYDMNGNARTINGRTNPNFDPNNVRIDVLKDAVNTFIDEIDENDRVDPETGKTREKRLGNQIAIVAFSGPGNTSTTPTADNSIKLNTGWRTLGNNQNVEDFTGYNYLKGNNGVGGLTANGATMADFGMQAAETLISGLSDEHTVRTVVFFTDGDPGWGTYWTSTGNNNNLVNGHRVLSDNGVMTWNVANRTIASANNIKENANEDKGISSKVYSVSIVNNPSSYTNVYLDQVSSNYSGAEYMAELLTTSTGGYNPTTYNYIDNWNNYNNTWTARSGEKVTNTYSFATTNTEELKNIFQSIAEDSGGGSEDLGEQSVTEVDVVSASFTLPDHLSEMDADELKEWIKDNIIVKTAPCTGRESKQYLDDDGNTQTGTFLTFGTAITAPDNTEKYEKTVKVDGEDTIVMTDVDDLIEVEVSANDPNKPDKLDKIEVKYYDYAGNWCGPRLDDDGTTVLGWHGHKVIVEIPIMMDDDAVGGADVATNGPGSGIFVNGNNVAPFKSPEVSLPINIHIRKEGLEKGESSKFTIERKLKTESTWTEVSSVFVTRHENDDKAGEKAPITKVVGMPSVDENDNEFIYRVVETNWSWSYNLVSIKGPNGNTIGNVSTRSATSDELETNPFIFVNEKKDDINKIVRHAESKATNTFKTGLTKNVEYDDSKKNTGTGREEED